MDKLEKYLLSLIPDKEQERIFSAKNCYIDISFLGFIETYYNLSKIIPKDYTIYDIGCGYNAQSYFFKDHYKYIAINPIEIDATEIFCAPNCEIYRCTIKQFMLNYYDKKEHEFAIVNYVPNWYNEIPSEIAKTYFNNLFIFYP